MPPKTYTAKQLTAAKRRRAYTLRKLNDIADESRDLSHKIEKLLNEWNRCMDTNMKALLPTAKKKDIKEAEKPCKKIEKEMIKLRRKKTTLYNKALKLEDKATDIEEQYNISEDEPF